MTVYVDPAVWPFGRMICCHMFADSDEELHAMAAKIGVARRWHQKPPEASWSHYDIAKSKRALAVEHGAVEVDRYGAAEFVQRIEGRLTPELVELYARLRARPGCPQG